MAALRVMGTLLWRTLGLAIEGISHIEVRVFIVGGYLHQIDALPMEDRVQPTLADANATVFREVRPQG